MLSSGKKDSGWQVGLDAPHAAVFELAKPLAGGEGTLLSVTLGQTESDRPKVTNLLFPLARRRRRARLLNCRGRFAKLSALRNRNDPRNRPRPLQIIFGRVRWRMQVSGRRSRTSTLNWPGLKR